MTTMIQDGSVIQEGYELDLKSALRMERQRGAAHAAKMDPASVAERRAKVQERGRSQS